MQATPLVRMIATSTPTDLTFTPTGALNTLVCPHPSTYDPHTLLDSCDRKRRLVESGATPYAVESKAAMCDFLSCEVRADDFARGGVDIDKDVGRNRPQTAFIHFCADCFIRHHPQSRVSSGGLSRIHTARLGSSNRWGRNKSSAFDALTLKSGRRHIR